MGARTKGEQSHFRALLRKMTAEAQLGLQKNAACIHSLEKAKARFRMRLKILLGKLRKSVRD